MYGPRCRHVQQRWVLNSRARKQKMAHATGSSRGCSGGKLNESHETLETANAERPPQAGSKMVQKRFSKVVENRGSCSPTPYYFFV